MDHPMNPNLSGRAYGGLNKNRDEATQQRSRDFLVAFAAGLARIIAIAAVCLTLVQLLYAIGWGFVQLLPTLRKEETRLPESVWMFASHANSTMLAAGVLGLACIVALVMVMAGIAVVGGWKPWLELDEIRHDELPPSMRES